MTWEPLSNIIADDPYFCAVYMQRKFDLICLTHKDGRHARTARRLIRTLKKSKYRQAKATKRYKHGWEIPRDYPHALQLDIQNGNTKWKDAIDLESELMKKYQVFKDHGKVVCMKRVKIMNAPKEHQKIRVHFVCLMLRIVEKIQRQGLWLMDTLPRNQMKLSAQELFH